MKQKPESPHSSEVFYILVFLIIASILFLFRLVCFSPLNPAESLWADEIGTVLIAQRPIPDMIGFVLVNDINPPFFYLLVHFWMKLGASDGFLRLLPFLFGLALLPATFFTARQIGNGRMGMAALLFLLASPLVGYYGIELRYPVLLALLTACSYGFLLQWIRTEGAKGRGGYLLFSVLAFYTHFTFLFAFAGQILFLLSVRNRIQAVFGRTVRMQILTMGCALPAGGMGLFQILRGNDWIKALGEKRNLWENLRHGFHSLSFGHSPKRPSGIWDWLDALYQAHPQRFWWVFLIVSVPLILLFAQGLARIGGTVERRFLLFFFGSSFFFPLVADLFTPFFSPKLLLPATVPFFIIVAAGSEKGGNGRRLFSISSAAFVLFAMVCSGLHYKNNSYYHRDDWKGLARFMKEQSLPGDGLFNFDFELDYYDPGDIPSASTVPLPPRWLARQDFSLPAGRIDEMAREILSSHDRLWIRENRHPGLRWLDELQGKILESAVDVSPPEIARFHIPVRLALTDPAKADEALLKTAQSCVDFSRGKVDPRQLRGQWLRTEDGWAWTTNESFVFLPRPLGKSRVEVDLFANSDLFVQNRGVVELYIDGKRQDGREVDSPERFLLTGKSPKDAGLINVQIRCDKGILPDLNGVKEPEKRRTVLVRRIEVISQ